MSSDLSPVTEVTPATPSEPATAEPFSPGEKKSRWRTYRLLIQITIGVSFLLAWQYLPEIDALADRYKFLNSFFISSPLETADWIWKLVAGTGTNGITLWPYLRTTIWASLVGVTIGLTMGALAGLIFSNSKKLAETIRPFIVLANSVPRVAIIPIFVVIAGPTTRASILSVIAVVFFLGFFNALQGGSSIPERMLDNARLLGASQISIMRTIRLPMVLSWTFAAVPNAISFGLIVAVTTELLAGVKGMGQLLQTSMVNANADLTFAVIVVLSVVGLVMYGAATVLRDFLLRWDVKS